jgi:hypothetical protein
MIIPSARLRFGPAVLFAAAVALTLGIAAAAFYWRLGLTLTHYDARGHLIVARRIIDSITPGWQQIGAVWLPLPHLLNTVPVQLDFFYRTGWSATAISIASFTITGASIASIVASLTASNAAAAAAAVVFALNPNVLYLQATPMTEPLLMALTTVAIAALLNELRTSARPFHSGASRSGIEVLARPLRQIEGLGVLFALACLTRYEAWPITASVLAITLWALWRHGMTGRDALRAVAAIALYPVFAIAAFAIFSRVVVGQWFVSNDFFVPENKALGNPMESAAEIAWGTAMLSSPALVWLGAVGLAVAIFSALFNRRRAHEAIVVSLLAAAAIPFAAFYRGHPFRIRYMVPLIAIEAIGCGVAVGKLKPTRIAASVALVALALATLHPFDAAAAMVIEAQWDRPNLPARAAVTRCVGRLDPGAKVMASMGSLGHYMQEAAEDGFRIRDFLHEGNGDIWLAALERPRPFADWLLIEEKAEGGDMLARIARERPDFLDGYSRVCEGAGLALYRRN